MGNRKQTIQIIVIVICFGAAGLVLYNGFFKNSSSAPPIPRSALGPNLGTAVAPSGASGQVASQGSIESAKDVLPYGESLDFSKAIFPKRFQFNIIQYPKLDPKTEVGIQQENIIVTIP